MKQTRLVYICDWLPPDFGAVGQYAMLFAREWAKSGWQVTLVGLTSGEPRREPNEPVGEGTLEVIRIHRPTYEKQRVAERLRLDSRFEPGAVEGGIWLHAAGGCGTVHGQPSADVAFHCAAQPDHQEEAHLPDHATFIRSVLSPSAGRLDFS